LGIPEDVTWAECSDIVYVLLLGDWIHNLVPDVVNVLNNGLDVLVYSGTEDLICNYKGGELWTNNMEWSGKSGFNSADYEKWLVDGVVAGQSKTYSNLTFLQVFEAGHMVPLNQPENALSMINTFIQGGSFSST